MSKNAKAPLWLELTVPNVSYLHRLIVKQIQEGSIHNVHPRVRRGLDPVGVAGVSRIYNDPNAGSYRYSLKRKGRAIESIENRTKHPKTARTPARTKSRRARKSVAASNAGMPELHEDEPVEVVSPAVAQVDEAEQGHESGEESVDDGK